MQVNYLHLQPGRLSHPLCQPREVMSAVSPAPPDQAARERIATDLDTTLFVEAGAGSGKTTALVGRVVALVTSGAVELRNIAAITFTEKAGAELRDRVRRELAGARPTATGPEADRCRAALAQLDGAAIGTLHSFAQRLLSEHPVEAQLPPRVEVLDEVSSAVAFDRRWTRVLDQLLDDPDLERTILLLHAANVDPGKLRSLALAFERSWDLVEDLVPEQCAEPPSVADGIPKVLSELAAPRRAERRVHRPHRQAARVGPRLRRLRRRARRRGHRRPRPARGARAASPSTARAAARRGRGGRLQGPGARPARRRGATRSTRSAAACSTAAPTTSAPRCGPRRSRPPTSAAPTAASSSTTCSCWPARCCATRCRGRWCGRRCTSATSASCSTSSRTPTPSRSSWPCASPPPIPPAADEPQWGDVDVAPGRLFVVGDPKQSIYRFRRADIAMFLAARERFAPEAGGAVELTANFRTVAPVIDWVNATFRALLGGGHRRGRARLAARLHRPRRPARRRRRSARRWPSSAPSRTRTAAAPTRCARPRAATSPTSSPPRSRRAGRCGRGGRRRAGARAGSATSPSWCPPARRCPFLEDALEAARIPYRAESSSLVYATRAVRDLLMVLRAVDDPTDHLRIVTALRTPLLGCGDDDLFRYKVAAGRTGRTTPPPRPTPPTASCRPASPSCATSTRTATGTPPPSCSTASPATAAPSSSASPRAAPATCGGGCASSSTRPGPGARPPAAACAAYLHWVDQQTAEGARVAESVLPETDDDAVRIMTIHAAKGLEFPITIVSGMSARPGGMRSPVEVHFPQDGGGRLPLGQGVVTEEFEAAVPIDEQMGYDERIRLLYVACTRACDHLVVSLHRVERKNPPAKNSSRTNAELLARRHGRPARRPARRRRRARRPARRPRRGARRRRRRSTTWEAERAAALGGGQPSRAPSPPPRSPTRARPTGAPTSSRRRPPGLRGPPMQPSLFDDPAEPAPTPVAEPWVGEDGDPGPLEPDVDPGLQKRPRDLDLPPWLKGRYGTAVGPGRPRRAADDRPRHRRRARRRGRRPVPGRGGARPGRRRAPARAASALGSPVVQAAAARPHWREVYACTPDRRPAARGLRRPPLPRRRRPGGRRPQDRRQRRPRRARPPGRRLPAAGRRLRPGGRAGHGRAGHRVVFLFLTPQGAIERELADLDAAMADVERLVPTGEELVTP